jgi:PAP2 superfamily
MSVSLQTVAMPRSGFGSLLMQGIRGQSIFIFFSLSYLLALLLAEKFVPEMSRHSATELVLGIVTCSIPIALFALILYTFGKMAVTDKPERPLKALYQRVKSVLVSPLQMSSGLPLFASLVLFMYCFTVFKGNIAVIEPFSWDKTFDHWDTTLHFGYRAWELLHPVFGNAPMTFLLNFNYNLWFFIMNFFWVHYAFIAKPGAERSRFYLTFFMTWAIGGSLAATFFSSAGPCYFGNLGLGPDPYLPLMSYLKDVNNIIPIWAVDTQAYLWTEYAAGSLYGGVTAMPSMHNATAMLFVLTTWNKGGWLRWLMVAHCTLIFLGSIHLGWHYAVDGYAAWILVVGFWMLAGAVVRWWEARGHVQEFNAVHAARAT